MTQDLVDLHLLPHRRRKKDATGVVDLNAPVVTENDEFEVVTLEADEMWSFVGSKANHQWLWLVMHEASRQILAFHVGKRNKASAEALLSKIPLDLKNPSFTQISFSLEKNRSN